MRKRAVLIAGPTASGKSALALALAERTGGFIVNADSMQVYRDLRVITARPSRKEEARAPHRLYGHIDAAEIYSTGRWLVEAKEEIERARNQDRPLLVAGGTGLYFSALLKGLSVMPAVSSEVRMQVRAASQAIDTGALHEILRTRDPDTAAQLRPSDRQRILRALEVMEATGSGLSVWRARPGTPLFARNEYEAVFLEADREMLGRRIDDRFDAMLKSGAIEEVRALHARRLDPSLSIMKAHGVPWLMRHLEGDISLDEAAAQSKRDTRRYAKRQATWFRNQLPQFEWLDREAALTRLRGA
jgi:tRNA dimethylallyltransferase